MANLANMSVYFAHAYASWERGSNENFNGLLREFVPKGKSFNDYSDEEISSYQDCINQRLRKILGYKSPAELFQNEMASEFNNNRVCTYSISSVRLALRIHPVSF